MDTKGPSRIDRTSPVQPVGRDADLRGQAREFQAALRREYLDRHKPQTSRGKVAASFDDRIVVTGERAQEAMGCLHDLMRLSPTFRAVLDKTLAEDGSVWIRIGRGGGYSRSTLGAGDEKVYINLDQGDLRDLLIHECGHALAKLEDGPLGGFGPNQRFQAIVKREIDQGGGERAYGTEVRPEGDGRTR